MKIYPNVFARKKLLAMAVPMLMFGQAQAVQWDFGEVGVSLDSQLSIGSSWRMEEQDNNLLNYASPSTPELDGSTSDDGNRNYEKGDAFSQIFKGSHDLQITYQNFGAFVRAKYWYDTVIEDGKVKHGHSPTYVARDTSGFGPFPLTYSFPGESKLDDSEFNDLAKGSGAALLDAFVYGSFDIAEMPLDVRLGRQVVSWGESTFIQGGINSINPVDAAAFRRPGAEVKEGLLPVSMVYANLGLTDSLSLEAFYQLEWQKTVGDGCGTYFSSSDNSSEGCNLTTYSTDALAVYAPLFTDHEYLALVRDADGIREAKDDGQYGLALRYFSDSLDTEFGFYAMNIHSRLPIYSVTANSYFMEYPEDIQLLGVSFAGNAYGVAVSGEVSHKMDVPLQINGPQITTSLLTGGALFGNIAADADGVRTGYHTYDVTQAQATGIYLVNRVLGASSVALVAEVGYTFVHDLDDSFNYGRSSLYGAGGDEGFVTESSWGYRAVASAKYTNAFAGVDLTPAISFSHDVEGYAPSPGGQFNEDEKKLGLTLKANYLQRYDASISYNMFMGGDFNPIEDRDFLAISAGVQF